MHILLIKCGVHPKRSTLINASIDKCIDDDHFESNLMKNKFAY